MWRSFASLRLVKHEAPHFSTARPTYETGSAKSVIEGMGENDVKETRRRSDPTIELTWALILASARHIVTESNSVRSGGWQQTVGTDLHGKTLGVLGLGRIGSQVARVGSAFGMNLT